MQAIKDRCIIQEDPAPTQTAGGVLLPDTVQEESNRGIVISTGSGIRELQKGDRVLYTKYVGAELPHRGEETFVALKEEDIVGIILEE